VALAGLTGGRVLGTVNMPTSLNNIDFEVSGDVGATLKTIRCLGASLASG